MAGQVEYIRNFSGMRVEKDGVVPRFYLGDEQDHAASAHAGRPIFRSIEMVEVIIPGNPHTKPVFAVTDAHRQRWPERYEQFKKGMEQSIDGTPLEEWPILKRSQVLELKALELHSVDQVASMSDLACQRIGMAGMVLREKARAYLDDAARSALTEQLSRDKEENQNHIASLQNQVQELNRVVDSLGSQLQAFQNQPNPITTAVPYHSDPIEMAKNPMVPRGPVESSLDALAAPRKRGRPPKAQQVA